MGEMKKCDLISKVDASYLRIGSPRSVLVGVSGGADSVALMFLLLALREKRGIVLSCVHVNHGLRKESDDEESAVLGLCEKWQVPVIIRKVKVSGCGSLEANARLARYEAFYQAMKETSSEVLALAHHIDDQAETVLMRLLYGAGGQGLSAMRELNGRIWRPLLDIARADLLALLHDEVIPYCVDASNADAQHLRNRIRMDIMPALLQISPGSVQALARTAAILGDEQSYWNDVCGYWFEQHGRILAGSGFVLLQDFLAAPVALQRHLVRGICARIGLSVEFAHIERVISLAKGAGTKKVNLPGDGYAYRSGARLHIINPAIADTPDLGPLADFDGAKDRKTESFDACAIEGATIRTRQSGDYIAPLGAGGKQKLREYMINHKIDQPLRDRWPMLAKGSEVLWVVGIGISQTAAIGPATQEERRVQYQGSLPDELDYQVK